MSHCSSDISIIWLQSHSKADIDFLGIQIAPLNARPSKRALSFKIIHYLAKPDCSSVKEHALF